MIPLHKHLVFVYNTLWPYRSEERGIRIGPSMLRAWWAASTLCFLIVSLFASIAPLHRDKSAQTSVDWVYFLEETLTQWRIIQAAKIASGFHNKASINWKLHWRLSLNKLFNSVESRFGLRRIVTACRRTEWAIPSHCRGQKVHGRIQKEYFPPLIHTTINFLGQWQP